MASTEKPDIEDADGSSSRQEGIGVAVSVLRCEQLGGWERTFHHSHACLGGFCLVGEMEPSAEGSGESRSSR